jgi:hypothetical protein
MAPLLAVTVDLLRAVGLLDARLDDHGRLLLRFTNRTEVWVPIEHSQASRERLWFREQFYALATTGLETVQ